MRFPSSDMLRWQANEVENWIFETGRSLGSAYLQLQEQKIRV
jgi:hypothetical protein